MATTETVELLPLDTTDVDQWVGKPLGGANLKEPMTVNDIRRWAQAMQNPNPLYYDDDYAAASLHGAIVAPQSFTICCDCGHGATPAIQGRIEGSHMLFGGDEWWFYGPRIHPGDKIRTERLCFDYKVTNTSFAGPTMFQRGDTTYINQRGEVIAKQRSTSIRYIVENAQRLASLKDLEAEPEWSDEELERIDHEKFEYYRSFQQHIVRRAGGATEGEALPTGVIGPHSLLTFTTEWRAYTMNLWGATEPDLTHPTSSFEAGWLPEMSADPEAGKVDPERVDGLTHGPSRGHAQPRYAKVIGMPRAYGYGASMGAWVIDYVTNWAGEAALLIHSGVQYRSPALVGDVTYLTGTVTKVAPDALHPGSELVTIAVEMKTHTGATMARGPVTVRLPPAA